MAADQLSKWAVLDYFAAGREPREELTGFLNLVLVCNKGAAFRLSRQRPRMADAALHRIRSARRACVWR